MKFFDIHHHYNLFQYGDRRIEIPKNKTSSEYFESELIKYCKKLDMKVIVNGLGFCNFTETLMDMNDEVEKFFKNNEEYIIGSGFIDLDYDTPNKIDHLFKRGFKGIKIHINKKRYDDRSYFEFYRRCEYYNLPILFHTGISGLKGNLKSSANSFNAKPIFLEDIAVNFPKLIIIGAHLGYGFYDEACCLVSSFRYSSNNIFFDISGDDDVYRRLTEDSLINKDIPIENLLWGLDIQFFRYEEIIALWKKYFNKLNLTQEEQNKIFYKNSCKIFNIKC